MTKLNGGATLFGQAATAKAIDAELHSVRLRVNIKLGAVASLTLPVVCPPAGALAPRHRTLSVFLS